MSLDQRQRLAAMTRFLPAGAPVLNVGFARDVFEECVPDACVRAESPPGGMDADDVLNSSLELREGSYVVMCTPIVPGRHRSALLREREHAF